MWRPSTLLSRFLPLTARRKTQDVAGGRPNERERRILVDGLDGDARCTADAGADNAIRSGS